MSQSRPSGRGHDPRRRAAGSGPRNAARRTSAPRAGVRPGSRAPATRAARTPPAARQLPPRPRFTSRAAVLVLVLAVLTVSYASSMRAYLEQRRHIESLQHDIATSQASIVALQREKRRWHDPAFVRTVAHQRLGWVLPGEIGFQVLDEDGRPLGPHDSLSDPETVTRANRPLWWQAAWGSVVQAGKPEVRKADRPTPVSRIKVPKSSQPPGNTR